MSADATNLPETPAETPAVESSAPPTPLQTAEEKAATSHLVNVALPSTEEAGESEDEAAPEDIKLPKTLKATLDLISEGNAFQPTTPAEAKRKIAVMEKLRAHAHALSQGTPAPVIYGQNHRDLVSVGSTHAEEIHLTFVCRTDRIVDARLKADAQLIKDLTEKLAAAEAKIAKLSKK